MAIVDEIKTILKPSINTLGYDLWAVEYLQGKTRTLRIYIDKEDGISLDDCALVSQNISPVLDVNEIINSDYNLEVSSPGLDRELFEPWHYQKFIGNTIKVNLLQVIDNKRVINGTIIKVEDGAVIINADEKDIEIDFNLINRSKLVISF